MKPPAARDDHRLAASIARDAGRLLLATRAELAGVPAARLRAEGDRRSHELIAASLRSARPDDAILSEEGADDGARLRTRRVWIVDPLDGTREFAESGRDDWAVHVALWEEGELVAGAVALPARNMVLSSHEAPPSVAPHAGSLRLVVSRTRPPPLVEQIRAAYGAEVIPMGSAGAKVAAVVLGLADAYLHAGGQYEWDSAAPVVVARSAGLHASRADGSPLRYNQADPFLPDILVCRSELAMGILSALRSVPIPDGPLRKLT